MKKVMILMMMVLFGAGTAMAQTFTKTKQGAAKSQSERMDKIAERLGLTDEQKADMTTILTDFYAKRKDLKGQGKEARKALFNDRNEQLKKVFTEEQYEKFMKGARKMKMKKKNKRKMRGLNDGSSDKMGSGGMK